MAVITVSAQPIGAWAEFRLTLVTPDTGGRCTALPRRPIALNDKYYLYIGNYLESCVLFF